MTTTESRRELHLRAQYTWAGQAARLRALYEELAVDLAAEQVIAPEE